MAKILFRRATPSQPQDLFILNLAKIYNRLQKSFAITPDIAIPSGAMLNLIRTDNSIGLLAGLERYKSSKVVLAQRYNYFGEYSDDISLRRPWAKIGTQIPMPISVVLIHLRLTLSHTGTATVWVVT